MLAVSYGLTIVGANVAYTASQIWDKNITDFQVWLVVIGTEPITLIKMTAQTIELHHHQ